jgi:hypothetical protein
MIQRATPRTGKTRYRAVKPDMGGEVPGHYSRGSFYRGFWRRRNDLSGWKSQKDSLWGGKTAQGYGPPVRNAKSVLMSLLTRPDHSCSGFSSIKKPDDPVVGADPSCPVIAVSTHTGRLSWCIMKMALSEIFLYVPCFVRMIPVRILWKYSHSEFSIFLKKVKADFTKLCLFVLSSERTH